MPGASPSNSTLLPQRQGFEPIPGSSGSNMGSHHLEDIPLERVVTGGSVTGARKPSSTTGNTTAVGSSSGDEKTAFRPTLGRRRTVSGLNVGADGKPLEPEDGTLTRMGRIYTKIINFSVVTRYFIYVSPFALMIAVPIILGATVFPNAYIGHVKMVWFFTWIEIGRC
jgi:hypothetical protein